jgi:uncharacterized protein
MENNADTASREISQELLDKYFDVTARALAKVKIVKEEKRQIKWEENALDFFDMASRYIEDAKYFVSKGDIARAFGALNYAHGWLDAGARLGLFDVDGDSVLFTVD